MGLSVACPAGETFYGSKQARVWGTVNLGSTDRRKVRLAERYPAIW